MSSIYAEMQALASEILTADDDNFGQSKTGNVINILYKGVTAAGATAWDEDTLSWTPVQVKAVSRGTDLKRDGERLFAVASKVFTIYAEGVTAPTLEDRIEEAGVEHSIVEVSKPPNDGTAIVYYVYTMR